MATALDKQIRELNVALAELDTVRPKKQTFVKRSNVFFLERRDVIVKTKKKELQQKEQERFDLGLRLREQQTSRKSD